MNDKERIDTLEAIIVGLMDELVEVKKYVEEQKARDNTLSADFFGTNTIRPQQSSGISVSSGTSTSPFSGNTLGGSLFGGPGGLFGK